MFLDNKIGSPILQSLLCAIENSFLKFDPMLHKSGTGLAAYYSHWHLSPVSEISIDDSSVAVDLGIGLQEKHVTSDFTSMRALQRSRVIIHWVMGSPTFALILDHVLENNLIPFSHWPCILHSLMVNAGINSQLLDHLAFFNRAVVVFPFWKV